MPPDPGNVAKSFSFKSYWREILAVLILLLAIIFFRSERRELKEIIPQIYQANSVYLILGIFITAVYIFLQAGIYRKSFVAINQVLSWQHATILFLKRNFIGVFLPAGGVSALAYSPSQIRKTGLTKTQINQASGLFGFTGLLTVFLVGLPVLCFTVLDKGLINNAWIGLITVLLIIIVLFLVVYSINQKGILHRWVEKKFPSFAPLLNELFSANVNKKQFLGAVLFSLGVEITGIFHVYVAMLALGLPASLSASAAAYIIAVIMMVVSPFLRGLGAVELSMVYVLEQYGYHSTQALAITVLFRVFEFWLPLLSGLIAFAWKGRKIFFRIAPVLLTFFLGIVNIISVITPPVTGRLRLIRGYIPLNIIHASNLLVLLIGLSLLVTAAYLFRGLRNAWVIALIFSVISFIGHLTKALDYEEAIFAAVTFLVLIITAGEYRIRSSNKWMQVGIKTTVLSFAAVLVFGFISFYFIDVRHFGNDFTWQQSLLHTFRIFLLVDDPSLHPVTRFGNEFIVLIRSLGFLTWGFLVFTLIKPHLRKYTGSENYREKARFLLSQFGNSASDYFKVYKDKLYFFSDRHEAFIAYRIAKNFAIVLEEPVCAAENKIDVIREFDMHCRKMGLKTVFYRVGENSIPWFDIVRKQKLMIGQEAILEIKKFSLEGRDKKSLRNGLNNLKKNGYDTVVYKAPHSDELMSALKKVSDEWLESFQKEEIIFSQGMFDTKEIKQHDVIALASSEGKIVAFLDIIPDYTEDETTYDLIRKTNDAPGAAMDALIIKLIEYSNLQGKLFINMGLVPMSGLNESDNTAEQIIRLAANKIKRFQHYKGLRSFKEKYATIWENKYLVYEKDFDLIQIPGALNSVMKP